MMMERPKTWFRRPFDRRNGLRWATNLVVTLREKGSCSQHVDLLDVSMHGCRLFAGFTVKEGDEAIIRVPGFEPLGAIVVWSSKGHVGLQFAKSLHPAVVQHIVRLNDAVDSPRDASGVEIRVGTVA